VRFCPFCSAENADELAVCQSCGRRLPPLPPRRARNAPATGVTLPPRSASSQQPPPLPQRRTGNTSPPPIQGAIGSDVHPAQPAPIRTTAPYAARDSVPALPPPPSGDADRRALMNAISPGPAAQRREPPPPDARDPMNARRANEAIPSVPRSKPTTIPPAPGLPHGPPPPAHYPEAQPQRTKPPSLPPPGPHAAPISLTPPPAAPILPTYPVIPSAAFNDDFSTVPSADPIHVAAHRRRSPTGVEPPPTRINRSDALVDRPFTPPTVSPIPEIPEPGLVNAAKYTVRFGQARWQRRGAIKTLGAEIKQDTEALDQVLGALGREARNAKVEGRVFSAENAALTAADERIASLGKEHGEVDARKGDEFSKFVDVERERNTKLVEAERLVEEAQKELSHLEGQRRGLRDKRKELERRQKAYLKNAEDNDRQAGGAQLGDARQELRRSAEGHRKEAAALCRSARTWIASSLPSSDRSAKPPHASMPRRPSSTQRSAASTMPARATRIGSPSSTPSRSGSRARSGLPRRRSCAGSSRSARSST
jgi:hypothetical protein